MSQPRSLQTSGKSATTSASSSRGISPPRKSRAVACAECRRLKLKCDRDFPCLNCRRREVASLCPNGSLVTRSRLSSGVVTVGAQGKPDVIWMSERIKKLEEALALVQSKVSDEPHPLLVSEPNKRNVSGSGSASRSPEQDEASTSDGKRRPGSHSADK